MIYRRISARHIYFLTFLRCPVSKADAQGAMPYTLILIFHSYWLIIHAAMTLSLFHLA